MRVIVVPTETSRMRKARSYGLIVVTLVAVLNYFDRTLLGIALPQIKADFVLNDTELGLLAGPAFGLVYALMTYPLAALADRSNRRLVIIASVGTFSVATFFCGLSTGFLFLVGARLLTAVGEAGTSPAINSLISAWYPPAKRVGRLAIYSSGISVGIMVAFFGGGWLLQEFGWRATFFIAGVVGAIVAFLVLFIEEPSAAEQRPASTASALAVRALVRKGSFHWLTAAMALRSMASYAQLAFVPSFLARTHHLTLGAVGLILGGLSGSAAVIGAVSSGFLFDRYSRGNSGWNLKMAGLAVAVALPFLAVFFSARDLRVALAAALVPALLGEVPMAPGYWAVQSLVPAPARAQAVALLVTVVSVFGSGFGPLAVGVVSDLFRDSFADDSLRYALLIFLLPSALSAAFFWIAGRLINRDAVAEETSGSMESDGSSAMSAAGVP